ncbi:MAG: hypothetical protein Q4P84_09645, partial [Elusimicrobiales bacterium]|nr:hypothetical protein [Elusimicrobiales bacterium]
MKLNRYIAENRTIAMSNIMEFGKYYELKAAPGIVRIQELNAGKGIRPMDALVTPHRQLSVNIPKPVLDKSKFFTGQNVYVLKNGNAFYLMDPDYNGSALKDVDTEPCKMPYFRPLDHTFLDRAAKAKYEMAPMASSYVHYKDFKAALGMKP